MYCLAILFSGLIAFSGVGTDDVERVEAEEILIITHFENVRIKPHRMTQAGNNIYFVDLESSTVSKVCWNEGQLEVLFEVEKGVENEIFDISVNARGELIASSEPYIYLYVNDSVKKLVNTMSVYYPVLSDDGLIYSINLTESLGSSSEAITVFNIDLIKVGTAGRNPFVRQLDGQKRFVGNPSGVIFQGSLYYISKLMHTALIYDIAEGEMSIARPSRPELVAAENANIKMYGGSGVKKFEKSRKNLFVYKNMICNVVLEDDNNYVYCYENDMELVRIIELKGVYKNRVISCCALDHDGAQVLVLSMYDKSNNFHLRFFREKSNE